MYNGTVANVGINVVNQEMEPLLSGDASVAFGILTFHGNRAVRQTEAEGQNKEEDPIKEVYFSK